MRRHIIAAFCFAIISQAAPALCNAGETNLSVRDAIEIGLKNHPEIQKSKLEIEAANGAYWRDISPPAPSFEMESEFIPDGLGISHYDEKSVGISQDFEFPTVYFSRASRAAKRIDAARSELDIASAGVANRIKLAYYSVVAKKALLKVAEENLDIVSEFAKKAEIKVNVGEGTNLELLTAKVQLSEAKSSVSSAQKDYIAALNELKLAMGYTTEFETNNISFTDTLELHSCAYDYEDLLERSYERNSYLKRAAFVRESSEIDKKIAWMSLMPTFSASYMFQSRSLPGVGSGYSSNYYGFRLSMNFPLWFMFDQKGKILEADAAYQITTVNEKNAKNELTSKINTAYEEYQNSVRQLELYRDELSPQAREIFRIADVSYKAGEITYLEFLQAKMTAINAKINSIKVQFEYKESIVRLEEATGLTLE